MGYVFPGYRLRGALALAVLCLVGGGHAADKVESRPSAPASKPEPTYKVEAGIEGDIFPVFANYVSLQKPEQRKWGVVAVTVSNSTDLPLRSRLAVRIAGWSDQEIQMAELGAGAVRSFLFAPTFLPRFYRNREIVAATAVVEAADMGGRVLFSSTVPVRIRSAQDMYWGSDFKYALFIASWVTPHELRVEQAVARAKELAPGRRLPGYEDWKGEAAQEAETRVEARAIYRAVKAGGLSYVKSSLTLGENTAVSQRVRMPRESLGRSSANCIDASVLFASLFENLGMEPMVVLVPGHSYVGVRVARHSSRFLFIDTALTGRMGFEAAAQSAARALRKYSPGQLTRIYIAEARQSGIYPMP